MPKEPGCCSMIRRPVLGCCSSRWTPSAALNLHCTALLRTVPASPYLIRSNLKRNRRDAKRGSGRKGSWGTLNPCSSPCSLALMPPLLPLLPLLLPSNHLLLVHTWWFLLEERDITHDATGNQYRYIEKRCASNMPFLLGWQGSASWRVSTSNHCVECF